MSIVTVIVMVLAFGALASTALALARYGSSSPATRKVRVGIYIIVAIGGLAKATSEIRGNPGEAAFFLLLSGFFCLLAWVAHKGPPPDELAK
jgi:hypothetical protein